ncbi:MAG: DUF1016 N-terminal domain-containing protein [Coriobacteriia bacterium]|nr:DUF1016 N-terminal domain-containing protein [Coriobacteriia bacterium]MCL2537191.1 DUF1016 N-terminal domain-containing protein [Coriobacteriia bacterium]
MMLERNVDVLASETYDDIREIITSARKRVYVAANSAMVEAYWLVGKQIVEAQGGEARAEYGAGLIAELAPRLTAEFGKGFTESNLRRMRQFYSQFPNRAAVRLELNWTHYRSLMRVDDEKQREFYLQECADQNWSTRQLDRQINTHYYERLLATRKDLRDGIRTEIDVVEPRLPQDYVIKDTLVLDFLDIKDRSSYQESELEQALMMSNSERWCHTLPAALQRP